MNKTMYSQKVIEKSGLSEAGIDEEGEMQYLGTDKQFQEAEKLQELEDEMVENEVNSIIENQ